MALDAPAKIEWKLSSDGKKVELRNGAPYFVSLAFFFEVAEGGRTSNSAEVDDWFEWN
jgi:hypothetical protein